MDQPRGGRYVQANIKTANDEMGELTSVLLNAHLLSQAVSVRPENSGFACLLSSIPSSKLLSSHALQQRGFQKKFLEQTVATNLPENV